jgi:2-oxo-3-hexenedioate decarboxylase
MNVTEAAEMLLGAEDRAVEIDPLTDVWPELDLAIAYQIQDETLRARLARGEHLVGVKLGLTSVAKQRRMGIATPLVAWLTNTMVLPAHVPLGPGLIHPRAEPELVFQLGERLEGPGVTAARAMAAVSLVQAGVEVIDSRFRDFRFLLPDVVADNASSCRLLLGPVAVPPARLDLGLEACLVSLDGQVVDSATGAAVQGHPGEALALAANALAERSLALEEGWIVLTGGMTDAVPLAPGCVFEAEFTHLGKITLGVA